MRELRLTELRNRLMETKSRLTAVMGGELGERGEGSEQTNKVTETDNTCMATTRGKGGWGNKQMVVDGDLTWGGEHTVQYTEDVPWLA